LSRSPNIDQPRSAYERALRLHGADTQSLGKTLDASRQRQTDRADDPHRGDRDRPEPLPALRADTTATPTLGAPTHVGDAGNALAQTVRNTRSSTHYTESRLASGVPSRANIGGAATARQNTAPTRAAAATPVATPAITAGPPTVGATPRVAPTGTQIALAEPPRGNHAHQRQSPVTGQLQRPTSYLSPSAAAEIETQRDSILRQIRFALEPKGGQVQMRLQPPELGRLSLHMHVTGERVELTIEAERPEVTALLGNHTESLRQTLAAIGLTISQFTVRTDPDDRGQRHGAADPDPFLDHSVPGGQHLDAAAASELLAALRFTEGNLDIVV
jgi:flagellar hook-length control protein FliK